MYSSGVLFAVFVCKKLAKWDLSNCQGQVFRCWKYKIVMISACSVMQFDTSIKLKIL